MIGRTVLHFRIDEKLGAGGMGEVYRATDLRLARTVALKFIHPELAHDPAARRRFEREARALAALDHPHVGMVHGVEEDAGRLFLVLAHISGRSLEEILASGPLPAERARVLLSRIAEGLHAAHARGIVHRDIKCSNVMVTDDDVPKLVDFGIALGPQETRLTTTGAQPGTPGFTAPEVIQGQPADARSDLFSLGVVCYQALTGRMPFTTAHPMATLHAILNQPPDPIPDSAPAGTRALEPIVLRCLEKDPDARFPDARTLARALAGAPAEVVAVAPEPAEGRAVAPSRGPRRLRRWALGVGGVLVVALGWLGVGALRRGGSPRPPADPVNAAAVALLEFENISGDPQIDWMRRGVPELLGAAFIRSTGLDVFDAQRLQDLASQDARSAREGPISLEFLGRHGIRRAVTGSILSSGDRVRLQGRLVEVPGGRVLRVASAEGELGGDLFTLVAHLIPDLQVALEVNVGTNQEAEAWLREITTSSVDAYRFYLEGHQALVAAKWVEAARALRRATELDTNFVAAWADLAGSYWNLGDQAGLERTRARMRVLRGRADARSLLRIDLMEGLIEDDVSEVRRTSERLARLFPENRFYRYLLGRGHHMLNEHARCLATLAPLAAGRYEWPWTYMLISRSHAALGAADSAEAALRHGLEVTHNSPELSLEYATLQAGRGNREGARRLLETAMGSPAILQSPMWRGRILLRLAKYNLEEGRADSARAQLARSMRFLPDAEQAEARDLLRALR